MTESDFNVKQLYEFFSVDKPSLPLQNDFTIAFNDLTAEDVQTGNTVIQLAVKDPQKTTIDPTDYNDVVNFAAIKFEYANKDTKHS